MPQQLAVTSSSLLFAVPYSASASRYLRKPGRLAQIQDRLKLVYYRYEVTYGVYGMTSGEKLVANTFVLAMISLFIWLLLVHFLPLSFRILHDLGWALMKSPMSELEITPSSLRSLNSSASCHGMIVYSDPTALLMTCPHLTPSKILEPF
ncbi:hypothetical protein FQN57_003767 [Myotisia sp. PD_48]|nr:hypothetical protein FQN57_003767 [Myotisia sp. PD_48]